MTAATSGAGATSGVRVEQHGSVRHVVLAGAQRGNRIDAAVATELRAAFEQLDGTVRAVLLRAEGDNFCVGGDLGAIEAMLDGPQPDPTLAPILVELHAGLRAMVAAPAPVVCAVQGWVAGAGIGLLAASDIVLAGASARLRPAYLKVGLSPDGGTSWALARALGVQQAMDVLLADGVLSAGRALEVGLLSRVLDDADVLPVAVALSEQLAAGPTAAFQRTRELVRGAASATWSQQLDAEAERVVASATGPEGREGIRAFLESRPASFHDS